MYVYMYCFIIIVIIMFIIFIDWHIIIFIYRHISCQRFNIMEMDISNLKPPTGDTASISSTGRKFKKKSALTKLAEKKRRSSESGSEFGSCASLQSNQTLEVTGGQNTAYSSNQNVSNIEEDTNMKLDITYPSDDTSENNNQAEDQSNNANYARTGLQRGKKVYNVNVKKNPKPVPRLKKPDPEKCDWDPPPPLDANDNGNIGSKAPSDATIHRFRALKMANDPKGSLESLKSLPFQPKPPQTPKSERKVKGKGNLKGEKRNRDPGSSGEEVESKSKKQTPSYINLQTGTEKYEREKSEDEVFMTDNSNKTVGTSAGTLEVNKKDSEILLSNNVEMASPRSAKSSRGLLPPLIPKSYLPPLGDITSTALKVSMKTDSSYPHQKVSLEDSRIGDTLSQRSLSASSAMLPITIREARAR